MNRTLHIRLLAVTIGAMTVLAAFAQGTVRFSNRNLAAGLDAPVFSNDGVTKLAGPSFMAGLMAGPGEDRLSLIATTPFFSGTRAGYFDGGIQSIPEVLGGASAFIRIVAWDSTLRGTTNGATFAAAQAFGFYVWGESLVFSVVTGNPAAVPPELPPALVGLGWFSLSQCLDPGFLGFMAQPADQTVVQGTAVSFDVGVMACPPPLHYRWFHDEALIVGMDASSYQIASAEPADAGSYYVEVSDPSWGTHVSATARLTVLAEPIITSPPQSQTAQVGSTAAFRVGSDGASPLIYRWFFNGTNAVSDATTNRTLVLSNVQLTNAGAYTLVVTNAFGSATSMPANLNVIAPVDRYWVAALTLTGAVGSSLNLESCDALAPAPTWLPLDTVTLTNSPQHCVDSFAPLPVERLYRAWQPAPASGVPVLDLHLVPALALTGTVGSTVRVDGINQFGPTDGWFTVATIALTNTSQVYFDLSTIGQPPRLYRLVPVP